MDNMEKLKEQNEALKRVLKSKIKVYSYPICSEEHDGCLLCKYYDMNGSHFPCVRCKGTAFSSRAEYEKRKDYWRSCDD